MLLFQNSSMTATVGWVEIQGKCVAATWKKKVSDMRFFSKYEQIKMKQEDFSDPILF